MGGSGGGQGEGVEGEGVEGEGEIIPVALSTHTLLHHNKTTPPIIKFFIFENFCFDTRIIFAQFSQTRSGIRFLHAKAGNTRKSENKPAKNISEYTHLHARQLMPVTLSHPTFC